MIYKYCRRCGRRLIGDENRLRGFGEICFEKAQREAQGAHPLVSPLKEHAETQSRAEDRDRAAALKTEAQRDRAEGKVKNFLSENLKTGETPHLETTLNPTSKKPLLFRPHTSPSPPQ